MLARMARGHEVLHRLNDGLLVDIFAGAGGVRGQRVLAVQPGGAIAIGLGHEYAGQVAMLLTGGVRKSGDRLRATVHLVDTATASARRPGMKGPSLTPPIGVVAAATKYQ